MARTLSVKLDDATDAILSRVAPARTASAYIRVAIVEKAARDALRGEFHELLARVARLERELGVVADG